MDQGQLWFDFAWAARWAASALGDGDDGPAASQKNILKIFERPGRALLKVISVSAAGTETAHWQTRDRATAWQLARHLAGRLPPGERVKVRRTIEVVTVRQIDDDVPPPEAC